jgi:putative ABC transport system permease protein
VFEPTTPARMRVDALGSERLAAVLLATFAAIALGLSVVGIYGITRYSVEQKTKEFGIRLALGASRRDLFALVLRRSVRTLLIAIPCGAAGAWAALKIVASSIVTFKSGDPFVLPVTVIILTGSALFAAYWPARLAADTDPSVALHSS